MTRILRRPEVEHRTGLGRSAIYDLMAKGEFPQALQLSRKAVGWKEEEIEAWIESRPRRKRLL